ncbi:MFS transporter, partial [Sulfolobales archaeon SCGC AB-777_J03]
MDRDLSLLMISRVLRSFVAGYVSVIVGLYLLDKGFSLPEIGVVFAVGSFSNPLLSLAFGLAGDRAGTKRALLVSLFTLVIGLTLTYLSTNFYILLLAS